MLIDANKLWIGGNPDGKFKSKDKDAAKFNRVAKIQKIYPEIDSKLRKFCEVDGLTERKACAFSVLLMIECGIRVGNEDSADGYVSKAKKTEGQTLKTYGLTTLLREHVSFEGLKMTLNFIGKKSVEHKITITDPLLMKVGYAFYTQNSPRWLILPNGLEITDKMVNLFVKKSIGPGFTAKDFRTFRANIEAAKLVRNAQQTPIEIKKKLVNEEVKKIVLQVSEVLGNSPSIARKAYINPQILRAHWKARGFVVDLVTKKGKVKEVIYPKKAK